MIQHTKFRNAGLRNLSQKMAARATAGTHRTQEAAEGPRAIEIGNSTADRWPCTPVMHRPSLRYTIGDTSKESAMEKDVVCGMQVDPAKAAGSSQYQGKTYYFCSKACKIKFDANPGQFAK